MAEQKSYNDKRREKSRTEILENSLELFALNGFKSTTVSMIAKEAGLAKGSLYHYFESKEEILSTLLKNGTSLIFEFIPQESNNPWEDFRFFLDGFEKSLKENFKYWRLITQITIENRYHSIVNEYMASHGMEIYQFISNLYNNRLKIENADKHIALFFDCFHGWQISYIMSDGNYPLQDQFDFYISILKK